MRIWEQKQADRAQLVQELIDRLNALDDKQARMIAMALDAYGFYRQQMPHKAWIKIRKEVIDKAKAYLEQVDK
jgi:hypothetical protein